jgi:hypothetical protein
MSTAGETPVKKLFHRNIRRITVSPIFSMISKKLLLAAIIAAALSPFAVHAAAPGVDNTAQPDAKPHTFGFGGPDNSLFMLDGKPIQLRSGEIHPQRIPVEYWRHRVRVAKAMGLNTIAFYVFWNDLEQPDGSFDLKTGNRDIAGFLKICQEEGMWVMFRPGPYTCAEWDFGGIPATLLKHPDLKIRTIKDARFMEAQTRYLKVMADLARPFLIKNGGPIISTQLENEYGSWQRKETSYMEWLHEFWKKEGFGPFHTSDGAGDNYLKGIVQPGVAVGLDPGESDKDWAVANKNNPGVPVFSGESYPGWLRHWGEGNWAPTDKTGTIKWFMSHGKSFNLYVLHGGTNFGFSAGANTGGPGKYEPDLTSYDYGSPIDEQGRPTKEYAKYRAAIAAALPEDAIPAEAPANIPAMEIAPFTPTRITGLWDNLPAPVSAEKPPYFESFGQNQGLAIYSVTLPAGAAGKFTYEHLNDYGLISLDGKLLQTVDRRLGKLKSVDIPARDKPAKLEILVEGMGHINFTTGMESDRKGLFGAVKLDGVDIKGWGVQALPLNSTDVVAAKPVATPSARPGSHFRTTITLTETKDTFFDMSKYTKGVLWVNGHNLGRYWHIGPQLRLFCPGVWLKQGENTVDIVDLEMTEARPVRGCVERNYDQKNKATRNANNEW